MSIETHSNIERKLLSSRFSLNGNRNQIHVKMTGSKARRAIESFKETMKRGEVVFEDVPCFCGSSKGILISEIDRYGFYYPLVLCNRCGLLRANPRITQESYAKFYSNEYRDVYGEGDTQIDRLFEQRTHQGRQKYVSLMRNTHLSKNAIVFEIGCDFGAMLLPFAEAGHDVYGCDYGVEHIEYGRKQTGLRTLFIGGSEKLLETGRKADLVILYHVLEHFLNLEKELEIIHKITKPEGIIFIAVPGTFWWIKNFCGEDILSILQNAHTYQFSLRSLNYMMESCGFELISGNEEIKATFKISTTSRNRKMVPQGECEQVRVYLERLERNYVTKVLLIKILDTLGLKKVIKKALSRKHKQYESDT